MDKNTSNMHSKQTVKLDSSAKPLYQYFTVYIIAIFLLVAIGLSSISFFLSLQSKHAQTLITEQFIPLQTQLLQQTYLLNTGQLIDGMLQNSNADELIGLQQKLLLQSKKLLLLKSEHQPSYQQWFSSNNLTTRIVTRIESNHNSNEALKNKALLQLDSLLDAIKIQSNISSSNPLNEQLAIPLGTALSKQKSSSAQAALLSKIENELSSIAMMLKRLTLHMPLSVFEQLRNRINELFVADYSKQLSEQQQENQGVADIARDLIRFEDLILKLAVLDKWHEHLRLMSEYQQQLSAQQQQLQNILYYLSKNDYEIDTASSDYIRANKDSIRANQVSKWVVIIFAVLLTCIASLLWLVRRRMQFAVSFIDQALKAKKNTLIIDNSSDGSELELLVDKTHSGNYSESEYQALTDKNQILEAQVLQDKDIKAQLKLELVSFELAVSTKYATQLLLEQQRCKALHLSALKQLVLLGNSAVSITANITNDTNTENYLHQAHFQVLELVRELRQLSCYRYLQNNDALLILNEVNIVDQIQAVVLNLHSELFNGKNKVSVSVDEKILNQVTLDTALFSEMLNAFIKLLFSGQTAKQLSLHLRLEDKNNDQQIILFSGDIEGAEKVVPLPQTLNVFYDKSTEHSELSTYFNTLLRFIHGNKASVNITDKGYQFRFSLPLTIASEQQTQHYPVLSLPGYLSDIENSCIKLAAKYLAMPIEVLLAVNKPAQYQRLQQLLQSMGLQVMFVTGEQALQKNWQSGRFALLITEIACQPFINFMIDEEDNSSGKDALVRGVFSLANFVGIRKKVPSFSHWVIGEIAAESPESEIITAMQPWLKQQKITSVHFKNAPKKTSIPNTDKKSVTSAVLKDKSSVSFNVERYIKNQGSAELAIFMLDEYITENESQIKILSQAFINNDAKKADTAVQALLINSKILAADYLLHLCQHWQKLLTNKVLDNNNKVQISLLSKTTKAVQDISQYGNVIA